MKKLFVACSAICIATLAVGQSKEVKIEAKDVPEAITKKFTAFYSDVKKVKWEKDSIWYEAEFVQNKTETSVTFSADGNIIEKEWEIKKTEFPKAVSDSLAKNFAGFKIEEVSKVEKSGLVIYEAEINGKKDGKKVEYIAVYSSDGKLINKREIKD